MKGFVRYAKAVDWRLVSLVCDGDAKQRHRVREMLKFLRPDGIVSTTFEHLTDVLAPYPHVWLDAPPEGIPPGDALVVHEGEPIGRLAAEELKRLDLRHFAAIGTQACYPWSERRIDSFARALESSGATAPAVLRLSVPIVREMAMLREIDAWLKTLPKPVGLFAVNDRIAASVVTVANRQGLRIPDDLAIIGVDNDEDICNMTTPPLSSIATDWEQGGFLAGEMLATLLRNPETKRSPRSFGVLGVIRRTSTSPSKTSGDSRVAKASAYIREHACEGIGVEDVVRQMGCSRRLAMQRYLEVTGRSIFAEIRETQFAQVLVLLAQRDLQLGAIADRCGWKSSTALRTYFEKRTGKTLREWRSEHVAQN